MFLVSTSQHVLLLDTDQKTAYRVHSGKGLYYGLCIHNGRIVAACRNRQPSPDDSGRVEERGSLLFLDEWLNVEQEVQPSFPLRDVHGIASVDEMIWVTCAFDNLVAIFNLATQTWTKWYPASDPSARNQDVHHFNTIAKVGNRLALVAHNWGHSHILFYRYPSLELSQACPLGVQAHNVFAVSGALATCSSAEGLLVSESGWRHRTGGFPRGLAATDELRLVGVSQNTSRDSRSVANGVIRIFDNRWRYQSDYLLRGVGMILDILPISLEGKALVGLEPWTDLEVFDAQYNPENPGDSYVPGQLGAEDSRWLEWHAAEGTCRWTAACDAGMTVVVNAGESFLTVNALSGFPGRYVVDVALDGTVLGQLDFPTAGEASATFALRGHALGRARLSFRVPWLWQPVIQIPGSSDSRFLGVAVSLVRLLPGRADSRNQQIVGDKNTSTS